MSEKLTLAHYWDKLDTKDKNLLLYSIKKVSPVYKNLHHGTLPFITIEVVMDILDYRVESEETIDAVKQDASFEIIYSLREKDGKIIRKLRALFLPQYVYYQNKHSII